MSTSEFNLGDLWNKIDQIAEAKLRRDGLRIRVKTDLGTDTIVYDADAETSEPSVLMPSAQIIVEGRDGDEITTFGEPVKFSLLKGGVVYGSLAAGIILLVKGVKGFIK